MPLYEYYCEHCDMVFEALGSISRSGDPSRCPNCGRDAIRIMPTTFASMSRRRGLKERVPFHHHETRNIEEKRGIAPVKPRSSPTRRTGKKSTKPQAKG
jgi:putative FmdB family regulatory protein